MIDVDATAVGLARSDAALVTEVSDRIYGGGTPPVDYDPAYGGAVCLASRGGPTRYDNLLSVSIQAKCYGPTAVEAWETYKFIYDALHEKSNGTVTFSQSEGIGQALVEPGTGRDYVLAYFRMTMRV
jgi:hypothetical protein